MTQFWYGLCIGFVTGFFGMFILAVLFIRFYNRASEDERKYDDDRFMDTACGLGKRVGETDGAEAVTLLWFLPPNSYETGKYNNLPFPSRTAMERWMARKMEEDGILSCEFTYLQGINPNFWDVMADGKRVGVADLRNDKTMNK